MSIGIWYTILDYMASIAIITNVSIQKDQNKVFWGKSIVPMGQNAENLAKSLFAP